jgi:TrmH family RNA methyltransferase
MVITSLNNRRIKEILKLKEKKYRDLKGLFIVETLHLVEEAMKKSNVLEIIVCEGFEYNIINEVNTIVVTKEIMMKLSSTESNPRIIGIVKKNVDNNCYGNKLLILDNIQDPGNLGTIIRSSACFNFDTIVLGLNTVDLYNDKVIRSTEGMIFHENIIQCDLEEFLKEIKKNNYTIYTTNVNTGKILNDIDFDEKIAIIIGNEGQGVSDISSYADETLYIPMNKKCESLNASVATSIIMYEVSKKDYE